MDFAVSAHPGVQGQLDRLATLALPQGRFDLTTITILLARLGDPQHRLPRTFHIAGTNGKGSTCAFLRAMLEAQGYTVHAATKPHLVRYNERIRLAGALIDNDHLAALLAEVLDAGADISPSFFEVTAAAAFLAFARTPADTCIIEVGLGGRLDATNVLVAPAACAIAALGIDHEAFLLRPETGTPDQPLARIAFEKAAIARAGSPMVTQAYPPEATAQVIAAADAVGAPLAMRGRQWWAEIGETIAYRDRHGALNLPLPALAGAHQADNAALAVAVLRHQRALAITPEAMAAGITQACWPARLQPLSRGPLTALAPAHAIWLDGAHNADAAQALACALADKTPIALIFALMANRPLAEVLAPLAPLAALVRIVPIPGHDHHAPTTVAEYARAQGWGDYAPATNVADALRHIAATRGTPGTIVIAGSLYLAGEVLRLNDEAPD